MPEVTGMKVKPWISKQVEITLNCFIQFYFFLFFQTALNCIQEVIHVISSKILQCILASEDDV